ncbi:MAG: OmpA family protein [Flavobacteriales bacterium]|nr:OmpA family protein [Flavobacteriales bacterium]MCB9335033.1 OmpA family protein [Flavobacteriales bacterium]
MRFLFIYISLLLFAGHLEAQETSCPEPKKKAVKLFNAAQNASMKEAYALLIEATKADPNYLEAYHELAKINERKAATAQSSRDAQQHVNRAIDYYHKIIEICPAYRGYYASMKMGDYYYSTKEYLKAKPYYLTILGAHDAYKDDERKAHERVENIDAYIKLLNDTVPFNPHKVVGPSTGRDEYLPMLSPDNKYLFFTRKMPDETKGAFDGGEKELFIRSRQIAKGKFSGGIPMPEPFNLGQFQGGVSVSVNNKLIFITIVEVIPYRGDNPAGRGQMFDNADIYFSEFKDGVWTKLESIGSHINTPTTWEAQPSISSDNKTLYFTRVIDPFAPDMDIWKSERQPDGKWGKPENLGAPINTKEGDEKSPFMHSDSYTLYFSSTGHIGLGGYDIFYSKMDPKSGEFHKPINIGYPINTEKDEHGFIVNRDGDQAYFGSSDEDSKDLNIYSFELYEEARPEKVLFVNGEILDSKGQVPDGAEVKLKNTKTNREVDAVIDKETGEYVAVMTVDKDEDIMLTAKKKGYAFTSQLISSDEIVIGKPVKTEKVEIKPIEIGEAYQINDINFATNSFELNNHIMLVLNEFISFLKENPTVKIAIQGHTDNVGDPKENMTLSENRAQAVFNYLVLEDIDPSRLSFKGFGETRPIGDNNTEEGRAKNRRTEFVIVGK